MILSRSWASCSWRGVLNWPQKCTGKLLILVVIIASSPSTHITCHSLVSWAKVICQEQKDFSNKIKNVKHDLILNEYPHEFVNSIRSHRETIVLLQIKYTRAMSLSHMLSISRRNSDALETVSMSGSFSNVNVHFVGHW
jgi:hypothetical protein